MFDIDNFWFTSCKRGDGDGNGDGYGDIIINKLNNLW